MRDEVTKPPTQRRLPMRTEAEVRSLVATIEGVNERLSEKIRTQPDAFDEHAALFNSNGSLLCALRWCLGEDTIQIKQGGSR